MQYRGRKIDHNLCVASVARAQDVARAAKWARKWMKITTALNQRQLTIDDKERECREARASVIANNDLEDENRDLKRQNRRTHLLISFDACTLPCGNGVANVVKE